MKIFLITVVLSLTGSGFANTPTPLMRAFAGAGSANTPTNPLRRAFLRTPFANDNNLTNPLGAKHPLNALVDITKSAPIVLSMSARELVNLDNAIFSQAQAVLDTLTEEELDASFDGSYPIRSYLGSKLLTMISEADLEADSELTLLMDSLAFQAILHGLSTDITANDLKNAAKSLVTPSYNLIDNNDKNEIAKGMLITLMKKF